MKALATCIEIAAKDGRGIATLELWSLDNKPMGAMHLTDLPLEKVRTMLYQTFEMTLAMTDDICEPGGTS